MSTRLLLVRHGQIKANVERRWHGSTDSPLNWRGRRQAKKTGRHISKHHAINAVYSSPLQRCQRTAHFASRHQRLDIITHSGLAEMCIGDWEDMPFSTLAEEHDFFNRITGDLEHAAPAGESLTQVANRMTTALKEIEAQHEGETVLVVSHGVALAVALAVIFDNDPANWLAYQFHNCSLTEIEINPKPVLRRYNEHAHL